MRRRVLQPRTTYADKVLRIASPIAYWPLFEQDGAVANDVSKNGRAGAYTGVTLGAAGVGDGRTAATFDGTASRCNVYSAGLAGAFSGAEGTIAAWVKVAAWSDGAVRQAVALSSDTNNQVQIQRPVDNGALRWIYKAGGTTKSLYVFSLSSTGWLHTALTWSKGGDQMKAYLGGAQQGATQTGLGTWAGALASTLNCIGAMNTTPSQVWSGSLAHVLVCSAALPDAVIAALAVPS